MGTGSGATNLSFTYTGANSVTVTDLPTNGATVYLLLGTTFGLDGNNQGNSYTFTAVTESALTSPTPASTLAGSNVTFTCAALSRATGYQLWLGTTGAGSNNLYNSGLQTGTSFAVSGLPTSGATIYARLFTNASGITAYADFTYTEATQATLTSPTRGSTLSGSGVTFAWIPVAAATGYSLWLGSTGVGSSNLYNSHSITGTAVTVNGLPTNGETIYVRLNAVTNGVAVQTDCTYTAVTEAQAALTSPAPGSTLAGATATFTWTPAAGATSYSLWLGSTGVGSSDLYNSHSITATSATVSGLPTNGETIYARLNVITNGIAVHTDYTYTAAR